MRTKIKTIDKAEKFIPFTIEIEIMNESQAQIIHDALTGVPEVGADFLRNIYTASGKQVGCH